MKLYVETKLSAKNGKPYTALYVDNGQQSIPVTFDKMTIMRVGNLTPNDLFNLKVEESIEL